MHKPRFSLRGLLLLITVLGIGLWYWLQPIVVKEHLNRTYFVYAHLKDVDFLGYEVRTYRRGWPGEWIQHGVTTILDYKERKLGETTWFEGVEHGPCRRFDRHGYVYQTGHYRAGKPHGRWTSQFRPEFQFDSVIYPQHVDPDARKISIDYVDGEITRVIVHAIRAESTRHQIELPNPTQRINSIWTADGRQQLKRTEFGSRTYEGRSQAWHNNGQPRYDGQWHAGHATGVWTIWDADGNVQEVLNFSSGRLVERAGEPVLDYPDLVAVIERQPFDRVRKCATTLSVPVRFGQGDTTIIDMTIGEVERLPEVGVLWPSISQLALQLHAQIDPQVSLADRTLQVEFPYDGLPAEAALYLALRPVGLACEFRYEQLWITTLEATKHWQRSPGLSLRAPPESQLAIALDDVIHHDRYPRASLAELVEAWQKKLHITIRFDESSSGVGELQEIRIDTGIPAITLRAALGTLCDLYSLRCEVRGEELVIMRRDNTATQLKE